MNRLETVCTVVALVVLLAFSGSGFAAKGGDKGKPTGGEAANNLVAPVDTDGVDERDYRSLEHA